MSRRFGLCASLLAIVALSSVSCGDADRMGSPIPRGGQTHQAIKDGTRAPDHPSLVAIVTDYGLSGDESICSGTLIHPRIVLTAQHCLEKHDNSDHPCRAFNELMAPSDVEYVTTDTRIVDDGGDVMATPSFTRDVGAMYAPEWGVDGGECGHDLAMITLTRPIAASDATPRTMRLDKEVEVGETLTAIGYGLDGEADGTSGLRRRKSGLEVTERSTCVPGARIVRTIFANSVPRRGSVPGTREVEDSTTRGGCSGFRCGRATGALHRYSPRSRCGRVGFETRAQRSPPIEGS